VRFASDRGVDLAALRLAELQKFSSSIGSDVFQVLTLEGSLRARNHVGGSAPDQVRAAVAAARRELSNQ
jgi:argininosuccinate lyase